MLIDFSELPDHSRVWVYASSRAFSEKEQDGVDSKLRQFLADWQAHGKDIVAGYELRYGRFIIVGVNQEEAPPSGCSIDAKVRMIQELEKSYQVDLIDRMNVLFRKGKAIIYEPLKAFKYRIKSREITPDTIVFNNIVTNILEYKDFWEVPARDSWHNRFFR